MHTNGTDKTVVDEKPALPYFDGKAAMEEPAKPLTEAEAVKEINDYANSLGYGFTANKVIPANAIVSKLYHPDIVKDILNSVVTNVVIVKL